MSEDEKEKILAALQPFADLGVWMFASSKPDGDPVFTFSRLNAPDGTLTRGHFKAAHLAALMLRNDESS